MSSYQFVNTLAQCYAEQSGQNAATAAAAAAAVANQGTSGATAQDYYNMNYPNCYSPNLAAHAQQYNQYSLMMGGGTTGNSAASPNDPSQQQPQQHNQLPQQQQQQQQPQQPFTSGQRGSANQSPNSVSVTSSSLLNQNNACKYGQQTQPGPDSAGGLNTSGGVLGSPQDLSRASDGECPKTPETPLTSGGSSNHPPLSPSPGKDLEGSGGNGNGKSGGSSGDKVQSKSSSNSSSSDGKSSSSSTNPPHIYPWMKRVHLGQSKLYEALLNFYYYS